MNKDEKPQEAKPISVLVDGLRELFIYAAEHEAQKAHGKETA